MDKDRLERLIEAAAVSYNWVGAQVGVTGQAIGLYARGNRPIPPSRANKLQSLLVAKAQERLKFILDTLQTVAD